jgi:glutathione S-transferase
VKLYDWGRAPNARRVRIYLAEKDVTVPTEQVDLAATQHKSEAYTAINPMQREPARALDDDPVIAEQWQSAYFEALHPSLALFGAGPREVATVEM